MRKLTLTRILLVLFCGAGHMQIMWIQVVDHFLTLPLLLFFFFFFTSWSPLLPPSICPPHLAGRSVWNCWVNNFLCCGPNIHIFPLTENVLEFAAHLLHIHGLLQKLVADIWQLWSNYSADIHGSVLTKRLGNWAWFTRKFLFGLTVVINELTRANPPHLVVWILTCTGYFWKERKKEGKKKEAMWTIWQLVHTMAAISEFK